MKVVANLQVLMQLAKELGNAKKSGDTAAISKAQVAHDEYKAVCLRADEMTTGLTYGHLD